MNKAERINHVAGHDRGPTLMYPYPAPYYRVLETTLDEFVLGMLALGTPIETSIVGVFTDKGRGSQRDIELPLHKDGVYSKALAEAQGGTYVERRNIDVVGMYCIREGEGQCLTLIGDAEIELKQGQALVFDNTKVEHGRKGAVGSRILLRMWISVKP